MSANLYATDYPNPKLETGNSKLAEAAAATQCQRVSIFQFRFSAPTIGNPQSAMKTCHQLRPQAALCISEPNCSMWPESFPIPRGNGEVFPPREIGLDRRAEPPQPFPSDLAEQRTRQSLRTVLELGAHDAKYRHASGHFGGQRPLGQSKKKSLPAVTSRCVQLAKMVKQNSRTESPRDIRPSHCPGD